ncbi:putative Lipopolysaccharide biosynthesis protein [Nitrospira sp. KM1]|uniref:GumC family protein n=1 Tax=Nitrospira sp. KM1 TaxID=1936990 RepID=UPI0013A73BA0|nr:Wzz/FepE/Etk N-terminal domain-containing protein [Nitrospira sp. KM1]BCA57136.1 putative Lipopolysaccharide biosynthesis protein [Nitrospira sp. KM1]
MVSVESISSVPVSQETQSVRDLWQMFRRRRWAVGIIGVTIFALGVAIALLWPPVYRSKATILIEEQEIPPDLVRSAISSYADQRIETIKQQVMSRATLWKIIEQYNLYEALRRRSATEEVLEQFTKDIRLEVINVKVVDRRSQQPTQATIAFTLAYDGESPEVAQKVANEVTSLFLQENLKTRERHAQETTAFLKQEAEHLSKHIDELEMKTAALKQRADGALPELTQLNMQLMSQTERELLEVDRDIRSTEERKRFLEGELATLKPNTPIIAASGERLLDAGERLKTLRAQYASANGYLFPEHPDIIKMQQEMEALEREVGAKAPGEEVGKRLDGQRAYLASLINKYGEDHPDVIRGRRVITGLEEELGRIAAQPREAYPLKPENPAYINIQSQLSSTAASLESLKNHRTALKKRAEDYAKRVERLPQFEPEYQALQHDRESSLRKYHEIRSRLMEAQVSEGLEIQRKGERFSLIDPPDLPGRPDRPNRPLILILAAVLASIGGLGAGVAMEQVDETIRNPAQICLAAGVPPLALIPYVPDAKEIQVHRSRRWKMRWVGVGAAVVLLVLGHLFWYPLDVVWYAALRKLGLT